MNLMRVSFVNALKLHYEKQVCLKVMAPTSGALLDLCRVSHQNCILQKDHTVGDVFMLTGRSICLSGTATESALFKWYLR
jgi:hypothetical protein